MKPISRDNTLSLAQALDTIGALREKCARLQADLGACGRHAGTLEADARRRALLEAADMVERTALGPADVTRRVSYWLRARAATPARHAPAPPGQPSAVTVWAEVVDALKDSYDAAKGNVDDGDPHDMMTRQYWAGARESCGCLLAWARREHAAAVLRGGAPTGGGWVPVGERLPEPREDVLLCLRSGGRTVGHRFEDGCWALRGGALPADAVTHWMALPPGPERAATGEEPTDA